ncbi:MAG: T9SS type A sorting domain-containing protein [Bacteroidetes bacterium]|nr:T9SS type A sorting domain-containing protein [Bacteroidota bacterium]
MINLFLLSRRLPCSTPTPGNTLSSAASVCSGANFTLTIQNSTPGSGVTYQWQSADDAGFTVNVANLGTSASQVTNQTSAKYYQCLVTCSTGPSTVASNGLQVTMNTFLSCYCVGTANCAGGDHVTSVNFNTGVINNASGVCLGSGGNSAYSDYSAQSANVTTGNTYPLSVSVANGGTEYAGVWIDYDQSGVFDASEFTNIPLTLSGTWNGTVNITIPGAAVSGTTRMRVRSKYSTAITATEACAAFSYGETEDYTIVVSAPLPCSGTPAPGNTIASSNSICAGGSVNLSLQNATPGTGVTYQWYNSGGPIIFANSATYTTPALFAGELYYCDVTCASATGTSNNTSIAIVPTPVGGTATGPLTGVTYQNLSYSVSGTTGSLQWQFSTTAIGGPYADIPGQTTASLNITANGGGTYYVRCKAFNAGCTDDFSTVITTVVSVDGDNVCSAIPLSLGLNGPYTNVGATTEVGEVGPPGTGFTVQTGWGSGQLPSNSVWFSFVAPPSGRVSIGNHTSLNLWDNQFALWAAESCSPFGGFTLIAANDDSTVSASPFKAWIAPVCLVPGDTYYLQVDGFGTGTNTSWGINLIQEASIVTPTITGTLAFCAGGSTTLDAGAYASYLWNTGATTQTISPNTAGAFTVTVTDVNGCIGTSPSVSTTVNPLPTPSITGTLVFCAGGSTTLDAGAGYSGYIWNTGATTQTISPNTAGSFTVTVTDGNGCSGSASVSTTVNPLPTAVISGDANICTGGSTNLTINFTGTAPWLYAINGGTPVSTSSNPETVSVSPVANTVYTITSLSDVNCSGSGTGSATVTVSFAVPAGGCSITSIPVSGCVTNVVSVSTNVVPGAESYTWSAPAGCLINGLASPQTTGSNTVSITLGTLPGNSSGWQICVFAANACGQTNTSCSWIRGSLSTPAAITGSTVACPNTGPVNYSTLAVIGATSYSWTITGDASVTGTGTTGAVTFGPAFTTGQLCVRALLPCGYQSAQRCMTIANGTPLLGSMIGTFTVCPGATNVAYSVPPSIGATSYTWTVPAGATITGGQGTNAITVTFGPTYTGSNICVYATSTCGIQSLLRCRTVASNKPNTPGNIVGASTGVCGQTISYSVAAVAGATSYTWSITGGAVFGTPNGSTSIDVVYPGGYTTGQLCVTANNGCGSSTARCVAIKGTPANPGVITGPTTVCANDASVAYSIAAVAGATSYVWTLPTGATFVSGQGSVSIVIDYGVVGGAITVVASGSCGVSGTRTLAITMNCKLSSSTLPGATVNAYPNPVSTQLNVELDAIAAGTYSVELIDVAGRVIYATEMVATVGLNNNTIDVATFAKGVYTLSVKNAEGFAKQIRVAVQ